MKYPCVYILASELNGTLYVGVTSDLPKRIYEHREGLLPGFTKEHGVNRLVYFEDYADMPSAITREKQLKHWKRDWKMKLITEKNPTWKDLYDEIV